MPPAQGAAQRARRRRREALSTLLLVLPGAAWLVLFALLPLGFLLVTSFWRTDIFGLSTDFTLANYQTIASSAVYPLVLLATLKIAAVTTLLTFLISYPMAYFLASLDGRAKAICLLALFVPFWTSYVVRTFVWLPMLGRNGFVNEFLIFIGLIDSPLDWLLYSEFTVYLGLVYVYILFMTLPIYLSLDRLDPSLTEAAADLGAGPVRTLYRVLLPLSMPGILSGTVMVFLLACGAYVTPQLLGGTASIMFGNVIVSQYLGTNNWALGAALSVVLIAIVLVCLLAFGRRVKFGDIFVAGRQ